MRYALLKKFPYLTGLGYASLYCRFTRVRHFRFFSILLNFFLTLGTNGMYKILFAKYLSNLLKRKFMSSQYLQEIFVQITIDKLDEDLIFLEKSERLVVDIGAASPTHFSNSRYLLESGHLGILAEPNPYFYNQLRDYYGKAHKIWKGAIIGESSTKVKTLIDAGYLSSILHTEQHDQFENIRSKIQKSQFDVQVLGIKPFIAEFNVPERFLYLSIDTEGSDLDIIQNWPFQESRPICVTVEHNFNPFVEKSIDDCMKNNGYTRVLKSISSIDGYYLDNSIILPKT